MGVEQVDIEVDDDRIAVGGQPGNCLLESIAVLQVVRGDDTHIGGADEDFFFFVQLPYSGDQDTAGGNGCGHFGGPAPIRTGKSSDDRQGHAGQDAAEAGFRRIEITVGVEPDDADPRIGSFGSLNARNDADRRGIVPG